MLLRISSIITPDIYKIIYRMGHRDELAIVDANYKASEICKRRIYSSITENDKLLYEILKYFPLDDEDEENPVIMMQLGNIYKEEPLMWNTYDKVIKEYDEREMGIEKIQRDDFFNRTKNAYATIQTNDSRLHGNIIIKKGIVLSDFAVSET
jgi:L-fucose mutarotase